LLLIAAIIRQASREAQTQGRKAQKGRKLKVGKKHSKVSKEKR